MTELYLKCVFKPHFDITCIHCKQYFLNSILKKRVLLLIVIAYTWLIFV